MGRGGSRYGAGRPAHKVKTEQCLSIDVRRWYRLGALKAGSEGGWAWTNSYTGEVTGRIGYRAEQDAVVLVYSVNGEPLRQHVWLKYTACNFGGQRPWFTCPRPGCWQRVAVLFLRGTAGFQCRGCSRVAYSSQSEGVMDRAWRKQRKLEARLGENWQRPKGMHDSTHTRIVSAIMNCEQQRDEALFNFMRRHFPGGFKL